MTFKTLLRIFLTLALVSTSCLLQAQTTNNEGEPKVKGVRVLTDEVLFRRTPVGAIISKLDKGVEAEWLKEQEGSIQVKVEAGLIGWVNADKVEIIQYTPPVAVEPRPDTTEAVRVTANGLNFRNTPNGTIIGQFNEGNEAILLAERDGWYQVRSTAGTVGWIASQYAVKRPRLQPVVTSPLTIPESPPATVPLVAAPAVNEESPATSDTADLDTSASSQATSQVAETQVEETIAAETQADRTTPQAQEAVSAEVIEEPIAPGLIDNAETESSPEQPAPVEGTTLAEVPTTSAKPEPELPQSQSDQEVAVANIETIEEPATETIEEPATETIEEPATETIEEPATETIEEPVIEITEESATQPASETDSGQADDLQEPASTPNQASPTKVSHDGWGVVLGYVSVPTRWDGDYIEALDHTFRFYQLGVQYRMASMLKISAGWIYGEDTETNVDLNLIQNPDSILLDDDQADIDFKRGWFGEFHWIFPFHRTYQMFVGGGLLNMEFEQDRYLFADRQFSALGKDKATINSLHASVGLDAHLWQSVSLNTALHWYLEQGAEFPSDSNPLDDNSFVPFHQVKVRDDFTLSVGMEYRFE